MLDSFFEAVIFCGVHERVPKFAPNEDAAPGGKGAHVRRPMGDKVTPEGVKREGIARVVGSASELRREADGGRR